MPSMKPRTVIYPITSFTKGNGKDITGKDITSGRTGERENDKMKSQNNWMRERNKARRRDGV